MITFIRHKNTNHYWLDGPPREPNYEASPCGEIQLGEPQCCTLMGPAEDKIRVNVQVLGDIHMRTMDINRDLFEHITALMRSDLLYYSQCRKARAFRLNKMRYRG
jgi:hypothetical protein